MEIDYTQADSNEEILNNLSRVDKERRNGIFDNTLPIVDVEIPDSISIRCPLIADVERKAAKCIECKYFCGVGQKSYDDKSPMMWSKKYFILCNKPADRHVSQMVIE